MLSASHRWEPAFLGMDTASSKTALAAGQSLTLAQLSFIAGDCQGIETSAGGEKTRVRLPETPHPRDSRCQHRRECGI